MGAKVLPLEQGSYTFEEYLRIVTSSERPLEFLEGEILGMAGVSSYHQDIAANIISKTLTEIRRFGCRVSGEGLKVSPPVWAGEIEAVFYPDVVIYCPGPATENVYEARNPVALFEILSPSTADKDRGPKFERFRRIPSLRHYVLVEQEVMKAEHRSRPDAETEWTTRDLTRPEDRLVFPEVPFDLSLAEIYADIPV